MKRIVICCDGTWNTFDAKNPTNVVRVTQTMLLEDENGLQQIKLYDEGVGTSKSGLSRGLDHLASGMFGWGLTAKLETTYRALSQNYSHGDEIYIFGFSRGAYMARSLVGLMRYSGLHPHNSQRPIKDAIDLYQSRQADSGPDIAEHLKFRAAFAPDTYINKDELAWRKANVPGFREEDCHKLRVKYLGVWDTVGALGMPNHFFISGLFNGKYRFHDTGLSAFVEYARHAVAIDERRRSYEPTLWDNLDDLNINRSFDPSSPEAPYQQKWFPGDHSTVGGGGNPSGLTNASFLWVAGGAQKLGLTFNKAAMESMHGFVSPKDPLFNKYPGLLSAIMARKSREGVSSIIHVSDIARARWHVPGNQLPEQEDYRPDPLKPLANLI